MNGRDIAKLAKILKSIKIYFPNVDLKFSINENNNVCACINKQCLAFKSVKDFVRTLCFLYDAKFSAKSIELKKKENYKKKNLFFYWLENVAKYTTNKGLKLEELKAEFNEKYGLEFKQGRKKRTVPIECTE